ncbi:sigma-70 family RNA polymerase sigma factor [Agriterribacter sp.]|uniref:RNA polymerase sigma factor n=1 Tax=Agriterribacter sp. TaxID=2821509 RepID=UPI002C38A51D|nr:sigma-70 family RNA polymerase sigma factor [Agriterribacter sp.]HRP56434.1 sigma-70 family RNA polymerase sigma factor [Agriterribacter sp.]
MQKKETIYVPGDFALRFQQGDETGLQYFFDAYYGSLCLYAIRLTGDEGFACEMASEAFYQTWRRRSQFNTAASIRAYLYTVVKNGCSKFLRKKAKEKTGHIPFLPDAEKTVYEGIVFAETIRQLHQAMETLPARCCNVLRSLYVEGKSISETAKDMRLTVSTIKSHKRHGLDLLRRRFIPLIMLPFLHFML